MKLTLRTKTTLLVAALVVSLLAVVGYARNRQLSRDFMAELREQQSALADAVADDLADKLELHLAVLDHAAAQFDAALLADPAAAARFLAHGAATHALFDGTTLIDPGGRVIANDPPLQPGKVVELGDRDYFRQVLATGHSVIGQPVWLRVAHGASLVMAAPIRTPDGRIAAVLASGLQLGRPNMLGQLGASQVGQTGHFELVTGGARPVYVLHPDASKTLTPAGPVTDQPAGPGDLVTRRQVRGVNWELRAVLPAWEAWAPIERSRQSLWWQLSLMGAVTALLAWIGVGTLLRPLSALHGAIRTLRQAPEEDVEIDTHSSDERGDLARDFLALLGELRLRDVEVRAVVQASPLGFFRADMNGDLCYVNDAYLQQHGLGRSEMARGWLRLVRSESRDTIWRRWMQYIADGEPVRIVNRIRRDDGSELTLAIKTAPLRVDGRLEGLVGTIEDVTDRVAAEKALRVLTAIFDATPDLVAQADRNGRIVYLNHAARRALAVPLSGPLPLLHCRELLTPATAARLRREILPAVERDDVWLGETELLTPGRQELPVSHMVLAHRDRNRRIDRFSCVMRDISAEVHAKQALHLQTATLSFVTEATPAIVVVIGADLRYRLVNGAFERWHGIAREQAVGWHLRDVLTQVDYERTKGWIERALAGEMLQVEAQFERPAGRRHLSISFIPLRLADGAIDGVVGIGQDITAHRREEERLLELSQTDALTGVLNRAGFESAIQRRVAEDGGPQLALLYIDLDHFKRVNDDHGHGVGDELLRAFANRLRGLVRPSDTVARLGGDEFAVLLGGVRETAHAETVADKILRAAAEPYQLSELHLCVGASVGVAVGIAPGADWQALLRRADGMLYRAKHGGRGRQASALH
ncbi:MAG: diguanylate cyclase [Proteobacteria bacterium]|nr:diguanylate cyclase [Pseudomonadota bacterium]